jgi:hypothetical protein
MGSQTIDAEKAAAFGGKMIEIMNGASLAFKDEYRTPHGPLRCDGRHSSIKQRGDSLEHGPE